MSGALIKILGKKSVSSSLNDLARSTGSPFGISACERDFIFGGQSLPESSFDESVHLTDGSACRISGGKNLSAFVSVIIHLLNSEIEKRSLADEILKKYKEINLFFKVSEKLMAGINLKEAAALVFKEAGQMINFTSGAIFLRNPDGGAFQMTFEIGTDINQEVLGRILEIWNMPDCFKKKNEKKDPLNAEGSCKTKWHSLNAGTFPETGEKNENNSPHGEIINDIASDKRFSGFDIKIRSIIFSPLKIKKSIVGLIVLGHSGNKKYSSEEAKLLGTLASYGAMAIENARLYDEVKSFFLLEQFNFS